MTSFAYADGRFLGDKPISGGPSKKRKFRSFNKRRSRRRVRTHNEATRKGWFKKMERLQDDDRYRKKYLDDLENLWAIPLDEIELPIIV